MSDVVTALIETLGSDCVLTGEDVNSRHAGFFSPTAVNAKAIEIGRAHV